MASLRKRYRPESANADREFPVQTAPSVAPAAEPPPVSEKQEPELPERLVESDPVKEAEQSAISLQQRRKDMERAETLASEALTLQQRMAAEAQQQRRTPEVPAHVQAWISAHPEYFNDQVKLAELQLATAKCARDGLGWEDPEFVPAVERHLGLKQEARLNGNGHDRPPPMSAPTPAPAPRNPPRQQTYGGPPVSAPPTRDVPSWTSGRPASQPTRLTAEEVELARGLGISLEEYQQ